MRWTEGLGGRLAGRGLDALIHSFSRLSTERAERRGEKLGLLWMRVDKKHRRRTDLNLALAFPDESDAWRLETRKECFRHFGRVLSDFLRTEVRTHSDLLATTEIEGMEHVEAVRASGQGILACTAHFGNWERFGAWLIAYGMQMSVVAREADQGLVQDRVLALRKASGIGILHRGSAAMEIVRKLKRGGLIGILPDQNDEECFVPWFGHPAGTVLGPAMLHLRTGAILLPCYCVRIGPGRYRAVVCAPIVPTPEEIADPARIMARVSAATEAVVRDYPSQYLWVHDRWKSARRRGLVPPDPTP